MSFLDRTTPGFINMFEEKEKEREMKEEGPVAWSICLLRFLICERERVKGHRFGKLGFGVVSERYGQSVPLLPGKRLGWDLGYSCDGTRVPF